MSNLGATDVDSRLEEQLIDGILYAFQEQTNEVCLCNVCLSVCACVCVSACACVCMYVCMCMCVIVQGTV